AYLLLRRMQELGFNLPRVPHALDRLETLSERSRARDFKQVYTERGPAGDVEVMELMIMALIAELDAVVKLRVNCDALGVCRRTMPSSRRATTWTACSEIRTSA